MIAAVLAVVALAAGNDAQAVTGLWNTPAEGGSVVRLDPCGDSVCGRIVTSPSVRADPDQRDIRNHDPSLRGRTIRGLLFLKVQQTGPGVWGKGSAYDPTDGGVYSGAMKLNPDGTLRLTGCIFVPLCKSQTWTRAR